MAESSISLLELSVLERSVAVPAENADVGVGELKALLAAAQGAAAGAAAAGPVSLHRGSRELQDDERVPAGGAAAAAANAGGGAGAGPLLLLRPGTEGAPGGPQLVGFIEHTLRENARLGRQLEKASWALEQLSAGAAPAAAGAGAAEGTGEATAPELALRDENKRLRAQLLISERAREDSAHMMLELRAKFDRLITEIMQENAGLVNAATHSVKAGVPDVHQMRPGSAGRRPGSAGRRPAA